ncbi:hypothetical protein HK100_008336, partial [Physocladia obscura]
MFHGGASVAVLASLFELPRCSDDFDSKPLRSDSPVVDHLTNPSHDSILKEKSANTSAASIQNIEKTKEFDEKEIENMEVGFEDIEFGEPGASNKIENMTSTDDDGNGANQEYSGLPSLETVLKLTSENLFDSAIVAAIRLIESMHVNTHDTAEFTDRKSQMMLGAMLSPVLTLPASDIDGLLSPALALPPSMELGILPPVLPLPNSTKSSIIPPVMTLPPDDSAKPIIVPDEELEYVNETCTSRTEIRRSTSLDETEPISPSPSQDPVISLKDIYLDTTTSNRPIFENGSFSIKKINNALFGLKNEYLSYSTSESSNSDEDDYEHYEDASGVLNSVAASRALPRIETLSSVEYSAPFESRRRLRQQQQLNYKLTVTPNQFTFVGDVEPKKRGRPKLNRHILSPHHPKFLPLPTMGYFEYVQTQRSPVVPTPSRPSIRVKLRIPPSISSLTPTAITSPSDITAPLSSILPSGPLSPPQSLTDDVQQQQSQQTQKTPTVIDENVLASLGPAATAALRRRLRYGGNASSQIDLLSTPVPIIKGYIEDSNGMLVKRGRGRPRKIAKSNETSAITYYQMQKNRQQRESFKSTSAMPAKSHKKGFLCKKKNSHLKSRMSNSIRKASLNLVEYEKNEKYEDELNALFAEESENDDLEANESMDVNEPVIHYETLRVVGEGSPRFFEAGHEEIVKKKQSLEPEFVLALEKQMTIPDDESQQIHTDFSQKSIPERDAKESLEHSEDEIDYAGEEEIVVDDLPEETIVPPPVSMPKVKVKPKMKTFKKIATKSARKLKIKVEETPVAASQRIEPESALNPSHKEGGEAFENSVRASTAVSITLSEKMTTGSGILKKKNMAKKSHGFVMADAMLFEDYESDFSESNAVDDGDCEMLRPIDADAITVAPEHAENYRLLYIKLQAHQERTTQESLRKKLDSQKMDTPSEITGRISIEKKQTKTITTVGLTPASVLTSILAIAIANTRQSTMTGMRSSAVFFSAESKMVASNSSVAAKISTESIESKSNLAVATSFSSESKPMYELSNQPGNRRRFRLNLLSILPAGAHEKRYVCPVCGKDYKNANGVKYHLIKFHADGLGIPPIVYGDDVNDEDDCDVSFEGPISQGETASLEYHCFLEGCENIYKSVNGLRYHVKSIHAPLLVEAERRNVFDDYDIPLDIIHLPLTPRSLKTPSSPSITPTNSRAAKKNSSALKQYDLKLAVKKNTITKNVNPKSSISAVRNEPNRKRDRVDLEDEEDEDDDEDRDEKHHEGEDDDEHMKIDHTTKKIKSITPAKRAIKSGGVELRSSKRRSISIVASESE